MAGISCDIAISQLLLDLTDDKSILVQVMAWCHQASSHYMSQCWPTDLYRHMALLAHHEFMNSNSSVRHSQWFYAIIFADPKLNILITPSSKEI